MLTDLAESLETGAEFDDGWILVVLDDRLEWQSARRPKSASAQRVPLYLRNRGARSRSNNSKNRF